MKRIMLVIILLILVALATPAQLQPGIEATYELLMEGEFVYMTDSAGHSLGRFPVPMDGKVTAFGFKRKKK